MFTAKQIIDGVMPPGMPAQMIMDYFNAALVREGVGVSNQSVSVVNKCIYKDRLDLLDVALAKQPDLNSADMTQMNAMQTAIMQGSIDAINRIIKAGGNIHVEKKLKNGNVLSLADFLYVRQETQKNKLSDSQYSELLKSLCARGVKLNVLKSTENQAPLEQIIAGARGNLVFAQDKTASADPEITMGSVYSEELVYGFTHQSKKKSQAPDVKKQQPNQEKPDQDSFAGFKKGFLRNGF